MSKKYTQLAHDIIEKVGGINNINDVYHCQTRLRFKLRDESKADRDSLSTLDGVAKVLSSGGVFQVVIGTYVKDVFDEIEKVVGPRGDKAVSEPVEKKKILGVIIDFVAGIFQPIIPALSGAGMVKAVLALLIVCKVISNDSQTYQILNFFADAVFYFLPVLLAFTTAQKLHCNPLLAASVAGIMLHPNWGAMVTAGDPISFFEIIPFTLTSYTSSVIPIILVIIVQSYLEKFLEKWIPHSIKLVFVPMLLFLIMGTVGLAVLGPIGSVLGGYLGIFFNFLSTNVSWAPAVLIGSFLPIMVMFGLHNGVAPFGTMQMADLGYDSIFGPGCVCSNIAQATASLVVSLRTKESKVKQLAMSGSITAFMGITEPTLYGVMLPKKYPLVAAMIGGGCGGLYAGITQTHRFATGSSGLPAILLYIGDNTMTFFYNIIIALVITIVVTAVLTYFLSLKYEKKEAEVTASIEENNTEFSFVSPIKGKVLALREAKDEVFASETIGKGFVVEPTEGDVCSPFDGRVVSLFPTNHAIGLVSTTGAEVLIHIGIDTVELQGQFFDAFVKQGDQVKQGQLLITFDKKEIEQAGYVTQTMVIVTNSTAYGSVTTLAEGYTDTTNNVVRLAL